MNPRIKRFAASLKKHKLDALLVTNNTNITYLTQFPAEDSWLLVTKKKSYYITDSRYILAARQSLKGVKTVEFSTSLVHSLFDLVRSEKVKRLGFDSRQVSLSVYHMLKKQAPASCALVISNGLVEEMRAVKEKSEIQQIKKALVLHHEALKFLKRVIKPGVTEQDVLAKLEYFVKSRHAGFSFPPIVASGPNSCYPHAKVTPRKIRNNEPVLLDMGIDINGYKSDLTRMFFLGKIAPLVKKVNDHVAEAQRRAIAVVRPGIRAYEVDEEARNYLKQQGLAKYFGHSLGHGVGLDIHEGPRISQSNTTILKEGMVFTVEPAVYLPNQFGIRIEDMVLVTKTGCRLISKD